eukprot:2840283-Rhodomonas_salina.3
MAIRYCPGFLVLRDLPVPARIRGTEVARSAKKQSLSAQDPVIMRVSLICGIAVAVAVRLALCGDDIRELISARPEVVTANTSIKRIRFRSLCPCAPAAQLPEVTRSIVLAEREFSCGRTGRHLTQATRVCSAVVLHV